jgi:hypothetical protein
VRVNPYLCRADYEEILGDMDESDYQSLVGPFGTCPQPKVRHVASTLHLLYFVM